MLTRIHVYELNGNKIQFTYAHGDELLLVGAHYGDYERTQLQREMAIMNIKTISSVFIPKWTESYCGDGSLFGKLLEELMPTHIIIPHWNVERLFVARIKSYIEQYKAKNNFVDIQNVYDDFKIHDSDTPSKSNNNIVILSKVVSLNKCAIYAYRFEATGKWIAINLDGNNFETDLLKSDVVVFPTCCETELKEMKKAAQCLNSNVSIQYIQEVKNKFLSRWFEDKRKVYCVRNYDVVVTRNDSALVSCYYFEPKQKIILNKKEYIQE